MAAAVWACAAPAPTGRPSHAPGASVAAVGDETQRPSPSTAAPSVGDPAPSSEAFQVSADEAAAVATVERLVSSINSGDSRTAQALIASVAEGSDCDFGARTLIDLPGRADVLRWLKARIGDHDRLTVARIFSESPVFGPVVGVEFGNRSSDTLARLGFPRGIAPQTIAKVVLTPDLSQVAGLNLGPGGADPGVVAQACTPG
jgi:hypothetical protein